MKIISHRGYWKNEYEKNQKVAFERSFSLGFGTETDIREFSGRLIVSHDVATGDEIIFDDFLKTANLYAKEQKLIIALNIKSDGLSKLLSRSIAGCKNLECFVFDMSVPDMREYLDSAIPVFTRMSEVERVPVWIDRCEGVWLDSFDSEWFSISLIEDLLRDKKRVCIVSPELHKRNHMALWEDIKPLTCESSLILCTDFPEVARYFFNPLRDNDAN
jgi:glycerophosphoryl diester phosphodiesterase